MSFASWQTFFAMGGYALYVWGAYGLSVLVLAGIAFLPWLRHRQLQRELAQRDRRAQRRSSNASR